MARAIYLDHQATTPVDERVLDAMLPYLREEFGNPASRSHAFGWRAREAVEAARAEVAHLVGGRPGEVVFTSGATEAINLALKGAAASYAARGHHLVTCRAEHRAVLDTCRALERDGVEVTYLDPDDTGRVRTADVERVLREDTVLVAILWANNEVGTLSPVRELGELCHGRGVLLFTDASQAAGKLDVDVERDRVDLLALSGHKMYGPKGVGALWVRGRDPRVRLAPEIDGGGHERGLRSGTLNVPGIVGLGEACRLRRERLAEDARRERALTEHLLARLAGELDGVHQNGHATERLPGCLNLSFECVEAEALLLELDGIALSSGSACTSASAEPSHVLRAMGLGAGRAQGSIRFGTGRGTTRAEIDEVADRVVRAVRRLRGEVASTGAGAAPTTAAGEKGLDLCADPAYKDDKAQAERGPK